MRLVAGDKLIVRAGPLESKSHYAREIHSTLGRSGVLAQGRLFTEDSFSDALAALITQLDEAVRDQGYAQLVFDDYDRALRRSKGAQLQRRLYQRLIDSELASRVGVLLLCRTATDAHRLRVGSSLVSRLEPLAPPSWSDAEVVGLERARPVSVLGRSATAAGIAASEGYPMLVARYTACAPSLAEDVAAPLRVAVASGRALSSDSYVEYHRALFYDDHGQVVPTALCEDSGVLEILRPPSHGWPRDLVGSVAEFQRLIAGAATVTWFDRYLLHDLQGLERFLDLLQLEPGQQLRLLACRRNGSAVVDEREASRLVQRNPGVDARFVSTLRRSELHDRHLVVASGGGGWVVPTAGVVVGSHVPGSAVAAPVPGFPIDYDVVWNESASLAEAN